MSWSILIGDPDKVNSPVDVSKLGTIPCGGFKVSQEIWTCCAPS